MNTTEFEEARRAHDARQQVRTMQVPRWAGWFVARRLTRHGWRIVHRRGGTILFRGT
jgi:hypothetical protein